MRPEYQYKNMDKPKGMLCPQCKESTVGYDSPRKLVNHLFGTHFIDSKNAWTIATQIYNEYLKQSNVTIREVTQEIPKRNYAIGKYAVELPTYVELKSNGNSKKDHLPSPDEVKAIVEKQNPVTLVPPTKPRSGILIHGSNESFRGKVVFSSEISKQVEDQEIKKVVRARKKLSRDVLIKKLDCNIIRLENEIHRQRLMRNILNELREYIP